MFDGNFGQHKQSRTSLLSRFGLGSPADRLVFSTTFVITVTYFHLETCGKLLKTGTFVHCLLLFFNTHNRLTLSLMYSF